MSDIIQEQNIKANKGTNSLTVQKESINQKEILSDADCFHAEITNDLIDLYPGYKITNVDHSKDGKTKYFTIVEKDKEIPCCPHCGSNNIFKHGYQKCSLKDSKIGDQKVKLNCLTQRYKCTCCNKTFGSKISFKHPQHSITLRLFNVIREMMDTCKVSASFVEDFLGVSRKTIMQIDKANAIHQMKDISTDNLRYVAIDEHAVHANHQYVTFILNAETSQVIFCCCGKSKADLQPFFDLLKERDHAKNILGVSCDCNAGFINMFKENCPNVHVVIDEFHVLKSFNDFMQIIRKQKKRETQNKVKECDKQIKQLKNDINNFSIKQEDKMVEALESLLKEKETELCKLKEEVEFCEKAKWFLCKGFSCVKEEQEGTKFFDFLNSDETFLEFLQKGDDIRSLWHSACSPAKIKKYAEELAQRCLNSVYEPIKSFGNFILRHLDDIKYAPSTGLSNSRTEGFCSAFKGFQRVIRGVKDIKYYIAKLHVMFMNPRASRLVYLFRRKNDSIFS